MRPDIRALHPVRDRARVADLYERAADYVALETGRAPDGETLDDFFTGVPPKGDLNRSHKLGLFERGHLIGIADLAYGFPDMGDAYLGLMLLDPAARGQGYGRAFLDHIKSLAPHRLFLAVLEANTRGRAFWQREGFVHVLSSEPSVSGTKEHIRHRLLWTPAKELPPETL